MVSGITVKEEGFTGTISFKSYNKKKAIDKHCDMLFIRFNE